MTTILPVAPHRLPGLGHLPYLAWDQVGFYSSLLDLGPVVRIYFGPMEALLLTDPALIHQVLVTEADKFTKGRIFRKTRPFFGNGVATSDGEFHLRQRRLMSPAFHQQRLAGYGEVMRAEVERMTKGWRSGQRIAWEKAMYAVTPHIIGKTLFHSDLGEQAAAEIHRSLPLVLQGAVTRSLNPLPWMPAWTSRRYDVAGRRLDAIIDRILSSYADDDTDRGDLLSMLLNARHDDTGKGMSRQQARDEIMTLLVAGTETAAVSLSWLFLELSQHPEVESQLHTELDTELAGHPITFADLPRLPYLRRVVDETLRLHNPVPMSMRAAQAEVQLGPALARPGTEVVYSPLALHRDPRHHPRPLEFDPDRWARPPAAGTYLPFGGGRHRCIGERFAIAEMMIATATIAAGWRLRLAPGSRVRSAAYTTHHPVSLPMILERR